MSLHGNQKCYITIQNDMLHYFTYKNTCCTWVVLVHTFSLRTQEAEAGGLLTGFEASLVYKMSCRTVRATQRNPVQKKKHVI